MRRAFFIFLLLLLPAAAGCRAGTRGVPSYVSPEISKLNIRRIVVIPFADEANCGSEREAIQRAFMEQLEKVTSIEVVGVDIRDAELAKNENPRRTGKYRIETILELAIRHGADAVLFGAITAHRPYPPQRLGVRVDLISANSGLALWSCNTQFDLADRESQRIIESSFSSNATKANESLTWDGVQASPSRFATLVAMIAVATFHKDDGRVNKSNK